MHTFTNLPVTIHFYLCHMECYTKSVRLQSVFHPIKDDNKKTWNLKDSCARACDTQTQYEFHKNPLYRVLSPLGCDYVSLGEQFLTIQGILLPLKDQQPLVRQHTITSQSVLISSSTVERTSALTLHLILWNTAHTCIQHSRGTEQSAPVSSCRQQSPHLESPCLVVPPAAGQTQSHTQRTSLFHLAWQCCRHQENIIEVLHASTVAMFFIAQCILSSI
jgi:hypothetical protein